MITSIGAPTRILFLRAESMSRLMAVKAAPNVSVGGKPRLGLTSWPAGIATARARCGSVARVYCASPFPKSSSLRLLGMFANASSARFLRSSLASRAASARAFRASSYSAASRSMRARAS